MDQGLNPYELLKKYGEECLKPSSLAWNENKLNWSDINTGRIFSN